MPDVSITPHGLTSHDSTSDWERVCKAPGDGADSSDGGDVMFVFYNGLPDADRLETYMGGFDDWVVFSAEQPFLELDGRPSPTPPMYEQSLAIASQNGDESDSDDGPSVAPGFGVPMVRAIWPYYYRFLAPYDASAAELVAGADLLPRPMDPGKSFEAAASRAEMTFRHLRAGGNVLEVGTDRISTGRNLRMLYELSKSRGTGEIVRIEPRLATTDGNAFLSTGDILADLQSVRDQNTALLEQLQAAGAGKNKIQGVMNRLAAIEKAASKARGFQEGHGIERIPSRAISSVAPETELAWMRAASGIRVAGGILVVYAVYKSTERIVSASRCERPRVAGQEAGTWAGAFAGAWLLGKAFAAGGALLGVETGPGALVIGLAGGLVGGALGAIGGALGADWVYSRIGPALPDGCSEDLHGAELEDIPWCSATAGP